MNRSKWINVPRRLTRQARLCLALACVLTANQIATAEPAPAPSLSCNFRFSGRYLPGHWTPVTLRLTNPGTQPITGTVQFRSKRQNAWPIQRAVSVPARSTMEISGSIHPADSGSASGDVATVVWVSDSNQELARTVLVGERAPEATRTASLTVGTLSDPAARQEDATLGVLVQAASGAAVLNTNLVETVDLPRQLADYDAFEQVLLLTPPDDLDAAQRAALLAYVDCGGTLIVTGAFASSRLEESWLAPYLPVQIIGYRERSALPGRGAASPLRLTHTGSTAEAILAADAGTASRVILEDDSYVHLATRPHGSGRIVFSSFDPTALDLKQPAAVTAWQSALGLEDNPTPPEPALIAQQHQAAMSGVLGRPVPSIWVAVGVSGGFVLLLLSLHAGLSGARRPLAFGGGLLAAVVVTGGLLGFSAVRHSADSINAARLTTLTLGTDGRGEQQDLYAFYGPTTPGIGLVAEKQNVVAEPIAAAGTTPTMSTFPAGVPDLGIRPDSSEQIWQATAAVPGPLFLCRGTFTEQGLTLKCDNQSTAILQSPLLAWGTSLVRLPDVPAGQTTVVAKAAELNPPGVFTHGGLVGQTDRLRSELISSLPQFGRQSLGAASRPPAVIGWLDDKQINPLMRPQGSAPLALSGPVMLQARLAIDPSPAGSNVSIEGPFTQMTAYKDASPPPTDSTGSAALTAPRDWVLAVRPPAAVGAFRPTRATISFDIDAPQYAVTVQAQQFASGKSDAAFVANETAEPLGQWSHPIGHKTITFDLTDADRSPEGWLVLRFAVMPPGEDNSGDTAAARWTIRQLQISLIGTVAPSAERTEP